MKKIVLLTLLVFGLVMFAHGREVPGLSTSCLTPEANRSFMLRQEQLMEDLFESPELQKARELFSLRLQEWSTALTAKLACTETQGNNCTAHIARFEAAERAKQEAQKALSAKSPEAQWQRALFALRAEYPPCP
jgi:hypothetical protein